MDVFKLNMSSVLSSDFIKNCPVMLVLVAIFSFKMDLIKPIMIAFFQNPDLGDTWFMEFAVNFVFN